MFTTKDTMQPVEAAELAAIEGGGALLGPILGPIHPIPVPGPFNPFPDPVDPIPGPYGPGTLL